MPVSTLLASNLSGIALTILNSYLTKASCALLPPFRSLELDGREEYSVQLLRLIRREPAGYPHYTLLSTHTASCGCVVIIKTALKISASGRYPAVWEASEIYGFRPHTA